MAAFATAALVVSAVRRRGAIVTVLFLLTLSLIWYGTIKITPERVTLLIVCNLRVVLVPKVVEAFRRNVDLRVVQNKNFLDEEAVRQVECQTRSGALKGIRRLGVGDMPQKHTHAHTQT